MRIALAALALIVAASGAEAAGPSVEMIDLVPGFISAVVSPDVAGPGDVKPATFAACLASRGVDASAMRAAIRRNSPDRRMKPCLDKYIGL